MPASVISREHAGILWMVISGLCFVLVSVLVRHLGTTLSANQAAFLRYLIGLVMLAPLLKGMRWRRVTRQLTMAYIIRGLAHGIAVTLWFFAMARIPIAEVTAIGYTAPIFTALGAVLFLKESIRIRRALAIGAGFVGALIIIRPGLIDISQGALAQLTASMCFAVSFLIAKRLTDSEASKDILVMLSIFCTIALIPGAVLTWQQPTYAELGWLTLVAAFATYGHYALTRAFANAPLTVTQPFSFLQLVWAVILGYLLFNEVPDIWVLVGGGLIVASITYIAHRESQTAKA